MLDGILLENWFPDKSRWVSIDKFPISLGIEPVKLFPCKSMLTRDNIRVNCVGKDPAKALSWIVITSKPCRRPISVPIDENLFFSKFKLFNILIPVPSCKGPLKLLSPNENRSSSDIFWRVDGISPVKLLPAKLNFFNNVSRPKWVGIVWTNLFMLTSSTSSLPKFPSSDGMTPNKAFCWKSTTFSEVK